MMSPALRRIDPRVFFSLAICLICLSVVAEVARAQEPAPVPAPPTTSVASGDIASCSSLAVVGGTQGALIFYNSFLDELGRIDNPLNLKIRIDDCDPYFFYLNAEDVQKVGTFSPHYHHTRVAVKREAVVVAPLSSLVAPQQIKPKPKPVAGRKSATKQSNEK